MSKLRNTAIASCFIGVPLGLAGFVTHGSTKWTTRAMGAVAEEVVTSLDGSSVTVPGPIVTEAVKVALPDPGKVSWEELRGQQFNVTSGEVTVTGSSPANGQIKLAIKSAGGIDVGIHCTGINGEPIDFTASTGEFNIAVDLDHREGVVDLPMLLSVKNEATATAIYSPAKSFKVAHLHRVTFRAWIKPETGSATFSAKLKIRLEDDKSISMQLIGYDAPIDSCLNVLIPLSHGPTAHGLLPLNPSREMELKFTFMGHTWVERKSNALRGVIDQLLNTKFTLGKLPSLSF